MSLNPGMFPEQASNAACKQSHAAKNGEGAQYENPPEGKDLQRNRTSGRIRKLRQKGQKEYGNLWIRDIHEDAPLVEGSRRN